MEWMPPPDGIAMCQGADVFASHERRGHPWKRSASSVSRLQSGPFRRSPPRRCADANRPAHSAPPHCSERPAVRSRADRTKSSRRLRRRRAPWREAKSSENAAPPNRRRPNDGGPGNRKAVGRHGRILLNRPAGIGIRMKRPQLGQTYTVRSLIRPLAIFANFRCARAMAGGRSRWHAKLAIVFTFARALLRSTSSQRKAKRGTPPAGSMSERSSRMLFANETPKPQAPKNSVGIFVGINIF